jgi:hypothetical protein
MLVILSVEHYVAGYGNTTSAVNKQLDFRCQFWQHRFWHNKTIWNRRLMSLIKLNNRAVKDVTQFGSISSLGSMIFIKKLTASASATLSFVDGTDGVVLDDTYKEYLFTFKDIHPATDGSDFEFNMSTDSGSNYNVTKTTTLFDPIHGEDGSNAGIAYSGSRDLAQGTGFQNLYGVLEVIMTKCFWIFTII